ncbi:Alanine racemase [Sphingomonas antarctica]|uniref:alanine racemase n=1 Tax=Sphingomonas antarctica TaxID=2040274 RepID=UPI0039E7EEE5
MSPPLRLRLDGDALAANWRWLAKQSGSAACGAAIKADGYGLGARAVVERLAREGCRDFFVATYAEVEDLGLLPDGCTLSVLHGPRAEDMRYAIESAARPVINSLEQATRWRDTGHPCDAMVDTGMNRLGLRPEELSALESLAVDTLMSHLACADEDSPMNGQQRGAFIALDTSARRRSLANSAGICFGSDYAFDLTRPGLALYGGVPRAEAVGHIAQVAFPEAQIVQRRVVPAGETIGYGASWTATAPTEVAILNIGYADGYLRSFAGVGAAGEGSLPLLGRVSMDLVAIDVTARATLREGDWVGLDYDLPSAARASGLSQYELLTGLGDRFLREWRSADR